MEIENSKIGTYELKQHLRIFEFTISDNQVFCLKKIKVNCKNCLKKTCTKIIFAIVFHYIPILESMHIK